MSGNYCYSWNGEDYSNGLFDTEEEAIENARIDEIGRASCRERV